MNVICKAIVEPKKDGQKRANEIEELRCSCQWGYSWHGEVKKCKKKKNKQKETDYIAKINCCECP